MLMQMHAWRRPQIGIDIVHASGPTSLHLWLLLLLLVGWHLVATVVRGLWLVLWGWLLVLGRMMLSIKSRLHGLLQMSWLLLLLLSRHHHS